mmetsp:Transcript_1057/g.1348  ORF Transcript_1057/g.1348 Transcript_1057/m.1348 type:complete len:247 (+) Transcript_1057:122-862(+)
MITFVPYKDFNQIAKCLDDKRLGAQRYEAWSVLKWLRSPDEYSKLVKAGYCCMWKGYEDALILYINAMLVEWGARGKVNNLLKPYDPERKLNIQKSKTKEIKMPPWLGYPKLQSYHRHALISKFPQHYRKFGWTETGSAYNGSYLWPIPIATEEGGTAWILRWPKHIKRPSISIEVKYNNDDDNDERTPRKQIPLRQKRKLKKEEQTKRLRKSRRNSSAIEKKPRKPVSQNIRPSKRMKLRNGKEL